MKAQGSLDLLGPSSKAALERVRLGEDPLRVRGMGTTNGAAMRVTPVGIAVSTDDPEVFADSVWSTCQLTHATHQGFQSAALVAAAVSFGIDWDTPSPSDMTALLWKALTYVDSLPERGAWTPDPDVVAATRRAMQLVANPVSSSLEHLIEQVGTSVASAHAIPMAFALLARDPSPRALLDAANIGGDTDTISAIAGAILGGVARSRGLRRRHARPGRERVRTSLDRGRHSDAFAAWTQRRFRRHAGRLRARDFDHRG